MLQTGNAWFQASRFITLRSVRTPSWVRYQTQAKAARRSLQSQRLFCSTRQNQDESDERPYVSIEQPPPPEPRSFISYTTAAIIAALSSGFLTYRLFFYTPGYGGDQQLNAKDFVARTLTSKIPISLTSAIFNLNGAHGDANDELWTRGVWSLEFKQPQLQIARAYTPLPPVKLLEESEGAWSNRTKGFRFLIRREPQGEVSNYLHGLKEGSRLELRGPHMEFAIPPNVSDVIFLAGGTGIAPALQVAYALSRRAALAQMPSEQPVRMSILWASRTKEDVGGGVYDQPSNLNTRLSAIPGQLEAIQFDKRSGDRFRLGAQIFVDEEQRFIQASDIASAMAQRPGEGRKLILISGPEGFVSHYAGPHGNENGIQSQGPIGGVLGGLDRRNWNIWKL
ncbi:MAG: hypothetical protein Q9162_005058 [Coniocarpon cinnabarinum]